MRVGGPPVMEDGFSRGPHSPIMGPEGGAAYGCRGSTNHK